MLQGWLQIAVFLAVLVAIVPLLGGYMARVFTGERVFLTRIGGPVERLLYRVLRVDPAAARTGRPTRAACSSSPGLFWLALYLILRTQTLHPWNPQGFHSGTWDVTFNTASSFLTNTNWQFYGGETTMTYFSQMAGLAVQNFVSAAVGIVVVIALIRGIIAPQRSQPRQLLAGPRAHVLLYVLLPISIVGALVLVSQGVIQNLSGYTPVHTLVGGTQTLAQGPVASQEVIKELGTNGGGFFNVNSAHPVREPHRRSRTSSRCCSSSSSRPRSPTPTGAWSATAARAGRSSRRWRSCS